MTVFFLVLNNRDSEKYFYLSVKNIDIFWGQCYRKLPTQRKTNKLFHFVWIVKTIKNFP